ncbi:MAG: hypothetical protein WB390_10650, partial [Pseudolabrys sp.]
MSNFKGFQPDSLRSRTGNYFGGTGNFGAGTGNFIGQIRNDRRMRFSVHTTVGNLTAPPRSEISFQAFARRAASAA